jgi:hypothetical protein
VIGVGEAAQGAIDEMQEVGLSAEQFIPALEGFLDEHSPPMDA